MSKRRKTYTREFKLEALRLAETSGKPVTQIERELGLGQGQLHHWREQLAHAGQEAFPGNGHLSATDERIRQLERENARLRQEAEILKKAIAVFTPKPK
jgi:transposase